MRVLITGGAGYIGSVLAEDLLRARHEVVVFDNLSSGHRTAVPEGAAFIEADLMQTEVVRNALQDYGIEAVMHFAASALVGESVSEPRLYYRNNLEAGIALLNSMCDCSVKRLVFSSTAAVYGEPKKQPIQENDPTGPTNPYGETKLAFEKALQSYS